MSMKLPTYAAGLIVASLFCALYADASSCVQISACAAYASKEIPLIFRGEVMDVTPISSPPPSPPPSHSPSVYVVTNRVEIESVRFAVREVFKGKTQNSEIRVVALKGVYHPGKEYLVYLSVNPTTHDLSPNSCVRWQNMSEADSKVSDVQLLRDLASMDGKGAIDGRFYLGGADMGGGQAPLANTQVDLSISGPVNRSTQSEHLGGEQAFLFANIPPGDYSISAKAPAGVAVLSVTGAKEHLNIQPNSCQEVDWYLRVDSHIRGRVTDATGQPMEHASVGLFQRGTRELDLARGRFAPIARRTTDAEGRYDFAGINPGDYSVVLHPAPPLPGDPYPPVFFPAREFPNEAHVLHLTGPSTISDIDLVRPSELHPATVTVKALRSDGSAIANALVIVTDPGFAIQTAASGRTGADGSLEVQLFSDREYVITASTPDPNGQVQESPQCAGPVAFVAKDKMVLSPLVPDKTFQACRSAARPKLTAQ